LSSNPFSPEEQPIKIILNGIMFSGRENKSLMYVILSSNGAMSSILRQVRVQRLQEEYFLTAAKSCCHNISETNYFLFTRPTITNAPFFIAGHNHENVKAFP